MTGRGGNFAPFLFQGRAAPTGSASDRASAGGPGWDQLAHGPVDCDDADHRDVAVDGVVPAQIDRAHDDEGDIDPHQHGEAARDFADEERIDGGDGDMDRGEGGDARADADIAAGIEPPEIGLEIIGRVALTGGAGEERELVGEARRVAGDEAIVGGAGGEPGAGDQIADDGPAASRSAHSGCAGRGAGRRHATSRAK